jgi:large subunit ribosomal protein L1
MMFDRYLRAAEVGREPAAMKYELALRLKTAKNGAVLRNRLRLPHPVRTNLRVAVFCEPGSAVAESALRAGASVVGDDALFEDIKAGKIDFERAICHVGTTAKLNKSGVARVLGPRGMMPSAKMGTVATDVAAALRNMHGATEFRERTGAVRVAVGQLGYTPEQLADNIKALLNLMKKDMGALSDRTPKEIHEIVLSSTNGPGFSLNGDFGNPKTLETAS